MSRYISNTILLLVISCLCVVSCKDKMVSSSNNEYSSSNNEGIVTLGTAIPNVDIEWEDQNNVYYQANDDSIPLPWKSGSNLAGADVAFASDYKEEDGWELLYNFFQQSDGAISKPYLLFYNKYRGIMRLYFYNTSDDPSNELLFKLGIIGNQNTSLFNFSDADFASPMNDRKNDPIYLEASSTNVSGGQWYVMDFEIAYDGNATQFNYPNHSMKVIVDGIKRSNIELSGSQTGSINGRFSAAASNGSNLLGNVDISVGDKITNSMTNYTTSQAESTITEAANNQENSSIGNTIKNALNNLKDDLTTQAINFAANPVMGIFNSFLGGGSSSAQPNYVRLNMDTNIQLQGTIEHNRNYMESNVKIPGASNNKQSDGVYPTYDKPLGVFNISQTPTVEWNYSRDVYNIDPDDPAQFPDPTEDQRVDFKNSYHLDNNTCEPVINESLDLELVNFSCSLVYDDRFSNNELPPTAGLFLMNPDLISGDRRSTGDYGTVVESGSTMHLENEESGAPTGDINAAPHPHVFVRVFLTLEKTNGQNQEFHYIKTYKPNFVQQ